MVLIFPFSKTYSSTCHVCSLPSKISIRDKRYLRFFSKTPSRTWMVCFFSSFQSIQPEMQCLLFSLLKIMKQTTHGLLLPIFSISAAVSAISASLPSTKVQKNSTCLLLFSKRPSRPLMGFFFSSFQIRIGRDNFCFSSIQNSSAYSQCLRLLFKRPSRHLMGSFVSSF